MALSFVRNENNYALLWVKRDQLRKIDIQVNLCVIKLYFFKIQYWDYRTKFQRILLDAFPYDFMTFLKIETLFIINYCLISDDYKFQVV